MQTRKVTKVAATAFITIPGYMASNIAEIPPINNPSNKKHKQVLNKEIDAV
jgi:hypothetical protein